jgi:cephalosporin hydroxylase
MNMDSIKITWQLFQKPYEIIKLYEFLFDKNIRTVLEIGTFSGGTALVWAHLVHLNDGIVYTLDNLSPKPKMVYKRHPFKKRIIELRGDSHGKETKNYVHSILGTSKIDFLFIDGDHTYEGVKDDFFSYSKLVKDGGWIAFHDILDTPFHRNIPPPVGPCLVSLLWNEIKHKYKFFEILDPDDNGMMGIGVLQWDATLL